MSIYKPCDIRGHVATDLTPELYRSWGRTLGGQLEPGAKFVVGGDVRLSTARFLKALTKGLCQAGIDVVNLGILPTPIIYYARHRLLADGCAIVTASHNPPDFNGLKWMLGERPPTEEEVRALERGVDGSGAKPSARSPGKPRSLDMTFDYVAWLQMTWGQKRPVDFRIALDPMHGCWARRARRYLHAVFPRVVFSTIHDTPDPVFDGRHPDCSRPELLEALCETVYCRRAGLGIAFDGDGDRVAFVDNEGTPLTAEEATWILQQSFDSELAGESFVYDQKFSDRVPEGAGQLGAQPVVERSGHAFIRTRMIESRALFGAEISGHYFYRALEGGDDGLFTACRLIDYLARSGTTLAELRRRCPPVFMTPDLRVPLDPERRQAVIERVHAAWSQYPQTALDGVRVNFPDGWALVRSSVTEPALTFRFEATGWPALHALVRGFCDELPDIGDQLRSRYQAALGVAADRS